MGDHSLAPVKIRSERATRGIIALLLVAGVLAAITITGSGIAGASAYTGFYSPRIAYGGADVNNDGLVNATDASVGFFGKTDLIDGHLDCDNWDAINDATEDPAGDGSIGEDDDCVLQGFLTDGGSATYIHVVDGHFAFTSSSVSGTKSVITNGFKLPPVYEIDTSYDYADYASADWAWRLSSGKVDYDRDGTIETNGQDDRADFLPGLPGTSGAAADIDDGVVDLDDDGTITAGMVTDTGDTCTNECFFGLNVTNGIVQNNTPTNRYVGTTGATGPAGADGTDGVSGRVSVATSTDRTSANKGKTSYCSGSTKVLGGGYVLTGETATLAHLTVVANGPVAGGWRVRVLEATPTSGSWSITTTVICALA